MTYSIIVVLCVACIVLLYFLRKERKKNALLLGRVDYFAELLSEVQDRYYDERVALINETIQRKRWERLYAEMLPREVS